MQGILCGIRTGSSAPRSAKLSAATTVNHAARRGQILTQSSACLCPPS